MLPKFLDPIEEYYSRKVATHGPTAAGVDWNSTYSQELRFDRLLTIIDRSEPFSILDYGCGYGALVDVLERRHLAFQYWGFDLSGSMLDAARRSHPNRQNCHFVDAGALPSACDYVVASGTFNVKLEVDADDWREYVFATIGSMFQMSTKGAAFNLLTMYSDPERRRADLYYEDPAAVFHECKSKLSRHVSLLHDYDLFEFTVLVRRTPWQI